MRTGGSRNIQRVYEVLTTGDRTSPHFHSPELRSPVIPYDYSLEKNRTSAFGKHSPCDRPCPLPISLRRLNPKCDRPPVTMGDSPVNHLQIFP
ncbi:hypothetical protein [Cylindrospermopsis raciborskii]|uniref:hypothetical protein n=1 Tax=Cylindrospermopsis raciborskii TaxID=77022 RepID=UPI0022BD0873|nr:hypothetical protein [Cylindrospermopsis raciborskii]MCZ2207314.1 hypothetical protein [Cylindrospermopsis raciborskii PAMP2011]